MEVATVIPELERLTVTVTRVLWGPAPDGFAIALARTSAGSIVKIAGATGDVHVGDRLDVEGQWQQHRKHGAQFAVQWLTELSTPDAIVAVLQRVSGLGPMRAQWLRDRHGASTLERLDENPALIGEIPRFPASLLDAAVESYQRQRADRPVRLLLLSLGLVGADIARIIRGCETPAQALAIVKRDPYELAELPGIGFRTADRVALAQGTPPDDPVRVARGLEFALHDAELSGHCYLPLEALYSRATELLRIDRLGSSRLRALLWSGVHDLVIEASLVGVHEPDLGPVVATASMVQAEGDVADDVAYLCEARAPLHSLPVLSGDATPAQADALRAMLDNPISLLTVCPGVGKTTTVAMLVRNLQEKDVSFALAAPTGKAAKRLSEACGGAPAQTIHRLLEYHPVLGWLRNARSVGQ